MSSFPWSVWEPAAHLHGAAKADHRHQWQERRRVQRGTGQSLTFCTTVYRWFCSSKYKASGEAAVLILARDATALSSNCDMVNELNTTNPRTVEWSGVE